MNFDKTHFMQFTTKNGPQIGLDISCANKLISKAYDTKFLRIYVYNNIYYCILKHNGMNSTKICVDTTLYLKIHIEQIKHKSRADCYAVKLVKPFISQETLKMVYYIYHIFIPL